MFNRLSIRLKLVVLLSLSATLALIISSSITLLSTFLTQREESLRLLTQLAEVSSENLRAALAFHDEQSGHRLLLPLQANPHIQMALVEDELGQPFGRYVANGLSEADQQHFQRYLHQAMVALEASPTDAPRAVDSMRWDYTAVVKPILFDGHVIGKLAIVSDNSALIDKIKQHLVFQTLLSLLTLCLIVLLSFSLQRLFTRPIYDLLAAMRHITDTKDYSVRVLSQRQDEFNVLIGGFNTMLSDIHERDERLSRLATTDVLTGLANRRCAMDTLASMVLRAQRKREPLGVVMLDIDHFKKINDQHGHPVGDLVLQDIGALLLSCARNLDLVARMGGEEFLILCDNSDTDATARVAERIRSSIENHVFAYGAVQFRATASLGLSACVPEATDGQEMIKRADMALYQAKTSGRNRVKMWNEP